MRMATLTSSTYDYYCQAELCDEGYALPVSFLGGAWSAKGGGSAKARDVSEILSEITLPRTRTKALDLVIAAPKAVSVAYGLGDPGEREGISRAHDLAVSRVVRLIEQLDVSHRAREGAIVGSTGLHALGVSHRLSRAQDPHLHTHVVMANCVDYHDRRGALDYGTLKRHLGAYELAYRNELREHLVTETGRELVGWGHEAWRLIGVDSQMTEVFSKRRGEVLRALGSHGTSPRAREIAALSSRAPKRQVAQRGLDARWGQEARAVALGAREVADRAPYLEVSVSDPLLREMCLRFTQEHMSIDRALACVIERAWRGQPDEVPSLDGSVLRAYSDLGLDRRLALAGIELPKKVRCAPISSQRSVGAVLEALESEQLGTSVRLCARSERERALLGGAAQLVDRSRGRGPLVVVAPEALAPSELSRLEPGGETVLLCAESAVPRTHPREVVVVRHDDGRSLIVAESAKAVWDAYVERAANGITSKANECYLSSSPRALRNELAKSLLADRVVGDAKTGKWFLGERVRDEVGTGWVVGVSDGALRVRDTQGRCRSVSSHRLRSVSIVRDAADSEGDQIVYGMSGDYLSDTVAAAYMAVPGVASLSAQLRSLRVPGEPLAVSSLTVAGFSRARLTALEAESGRRVGEAARVWRLAREATDTLARVYDHAHTLGFDARGGRSRILDERAPLVRTLDRERARERTR